MFHSRSETRLRRNAGRSSELARWGQLPNMVGFGLLAPGLLRLVKVQRSKCHPPALVHWINALDFAWVARQEDPQGSRLPYPTETHQACRYSSEFRYYPLRRCTNIDPCRIPKQSDTTAFCEGCDRSASCFCDLTRRLTAVTSSFSKDFGIIPQTKPSLILERDQIGLQYEDRKITVKVDKLVAGNHNNMFRRKLCMERIPHCVILYTRKILICPGKHAPAPPKINPTNVRWNLRFPKFLDSLPYVFLIVRSHNPEQDGLLPNHAHSRCKSSTTTASSRPQRSSVLVRWRRQYHRARARQDLGVSMQASQLPLLWQNMDVAKQLPQPP